MGLFFKNLEKLFCAPMKARRTTTNNCFCVSKWHNKSSLLQHFGDFVPTN
jgi:hypothetical protein